MLVIIKVTEKCIHDTSKNKYSGTRTYLYEVKDVDTLEEAVVAYHTSFDSDNIFESNDSFAGGCLSSYVSKIELYDIV